MATQVVELTGDEAQLLRSLQRVIDKEREHERQLGRTAAAGDQAGMGLERAMQRVEAANQTAMKSLLADMRQVGPEGREMAGQLRQHMQSAAADAAGGIDGIISRIGAIDPAAAEAARKIQTDMRAAADQAAADLAEADRKANWDSTIGELRKLSPEAADAAAGIQRHMSAAERDVKFDNILAEIRKTNPAAAEAAATIRSEMKAADEQVQFEKTLAELRKLSPEAAKAAGAIRGDLESVDGDVRFDNIIDQIRAIDPAAADAAAAMRAHIGDATSDADAMFDSFTTAAVAKVGAVAASFVGVRQVLGEIDEFIGNKARLDADARSLQDSIAIAQTDAAAGFTALTDKERRYLLDVAPAEVVQETGNPAIVPIINAFGAIESGATMEEVRAAVKASAEMNILRPESIQPTAVGAYALQRAAGLSDPRAAISLLLDARGESYIDDPDKMFDVLAPVLGNARAAAPEQDPTERAIDASATFAWLTKQAADSQGHVTATAANALFGNLASFFGDLAPLIIDARAAAEASEARIASGKLSPDALAKEQASLDASQAFLADAEEMADPGTLFGRLGLLRSSPGLRAQFHSRKFGGEQFGPIFRRLTDSGDEAAWAELLATAENISADQGSFDALVAQLKESTKPMAASLLARGTDAVATFHQMRDYEGATRARIRELTEQTLADTQQPGFVNWFRQTRQEWGVTPSALKGQFGDATAVEAIENLNRLSLRRAQYAQDGIEDHERAPVARLDASMGEIRQLLSLLIGELDPESLGRAAELAERYGRTYSHISGLVEGGDEQARNANMFNELAEQLRGSDELARQQLEATNRMAAAIESQTEHMRRTADNTAPIEAPPDYGAAADARYVED